MIDPPRPSFRQFLAPAAGVSARLVPLVALTWWLARETTVFGRPEALVGLFSVAMLALLLISDGRWRQAARERFIQRELRRRMGEPSLAPALVQRGLLLLVAAILLVLSAARPKGELTRTDLASEGIEIMLCLDVSNSMRVRDMGGRERLKVAKELLAGFVEQSRGHAVGLVAFGRSAHVMCPFTTDADTLQVFLDDLDYDSVAKQGTGIGTALRTALDRFTEKADVGQAIILLSDGEDQGTDPLGAARAAADRGVVVFTIGLGSPGGATIPMGVDFWGNSLTKRYQGVEVRSRLDEGTLKAIAAATGGRYRRADTPGRLAEVLADLGRLDSKVIRRGQVELRQDIFPLYLLPALLLLAFEALLPLRRRRRP